MRNFEFKSQVATSREQSERLLKLGLKKETADMWHITTTKDWKGNDIPKEKQKSWISFDGFVLNVGFDQFDRIPAWSLHRLLLLVPKEVNINGFKFPLRSDVLMRFDETDDMYETILGIIERVIKEGYFNKDYLEEKK